MYSRKQFLWDANAVLPRRTRYRKRMKLNDTKELKCCFDLPSSTTSELHASDELGSETDETKIPPIKKNHELNQSLYENSALSLRSSLLLIIAFCLRFHITNEGLDALLKLLYLHMPESNNFPKTKYGFFQHFQAFGKCPKIYLPCAKCNIMLQDFFILNLDSEKEIICDTCCEKNTYRKCKDGNNFFIMFDIKEQIENILSDSLVNKNMWKNKYWGDGYGEITSGKMYKNLKKDPFDITLSFNTDGIPLFKSSSFSIWPIQLVLNELPSSIRKKHIILGGLWLGSQAPNNDYFECFVKNINEISDEGINWNFKGSNIQSKIHAVLCTCDSVARCKLQNIVQFNGYHGCTWCEKKGTSVEKGRGRMMSYDESNETNVAPLRNLKSFYHAAKLAVAKNSPVLGIKGPSCLSSLKNFNVISGFVVDYMHCVCLGIVKSFTLLWLNSTHQDLFYVSNKQKIKMNEQLLSIKTPTMIRRKPRSLDSIKYWKATEFLYWLLFYSPTVLLEVLPQKFYNHWLLLVASMHHLLEDSISDKQLLLVEYLLTKFVFDTGKLYGPENVTYNVHMLLHIPETVRNWGMVWNYSNFIFESFNGILKNFVSSSQKAGHQIAQRFLAYRFVKSFYFANFENFVAKDTFNSFIRGFNLNSSSFKTGRLLIGKPSILLPTQSNALIFSHLKKKRAVYSFKSIIYKGIKLIPKGQEHISNKRSANYIVFKENTCAIVLFLISYKIKPSDKDIYCIVNLIKCSQKPIFKRKSPKYEFDSLKVVETVDENYILWPLYSIDKIGILLEFEKQFVVLIPKALEKD